MSALETRTRPGAIRRRRECSSCNKRFTTYERVGETPLRVVKKDGTRVPFERGKILLTACDLLVIDEAEFAAFRREAKVGVILAQLQAVLEMSRRHAGETLQRGTAIDSPARTVGYLSARLRDYPYEVFAALFLDNRHRVIRVAEMFQGTIDGASVHPRVVAQRALELNAAAIVFFHNHPSGVAEPSQADERITRRLKAALELLRCEQIEGS